MAGGDVEGTHGWGGCKRQARRGERHLEVMRGKRSGRGEATAYLLIHLCGEAIHVAVHRCKECWRRA